MKSIRQTYLINAPLKKVWQALVDPKIIDEWGGGSAKMSAIKGGDFSLLRKVLDCSFEPMNQ